MIWTDPTPKCAHVVARPGCACCSAEVRAITRRLNTDLSRRGFIAGTTASVALLGIAAYSGASAQTTEGPATLFTNARLFDGMNLNTREGMSVLVQGGLIVDVVQGPGEYAVRFDGRTLPTGVYYYRLTVRPTDAAAGRDTRSGAGEFGETRRMLLVR